MVSTCVTHVTDLAPALLALMKWGDRHYPAPGGPPRLTLPAGCGGTVGTDLRCERCGDRAISGHVFDVTTGLSSPHPHKPPLSPHARIAGRIRQRPRDPQPVVASRSHSGSDTTTAARPAAHARSPSLPPFARGRRHA
jgi:hypothetical protein